MALVYGGRNGEHAVSRRSAASILAHLDPEIYQVTEVLIEEDGRWQVGGRPVAMAGALRTLREQDLVFPALHGPYGEDGRLQALLEWLEVPYVGNGVFASAAGMDKTVTKKLLAADGLRVAAGVTIDGDDLPLPERRRLGLPVFVKPARAGSSLGVSKVRHWGRLPAAVRLARGFDDKVLIERAITGREIDVAVLQHPDGRIEAGPPLEITVVDRTFFDYDAKYTGGAAFEIPAALEAATTGLLQDRAVRAFQSLGCRGLLRVDFFLPPPGAGESGEPVVNEVNTFPGMTAESQFPQIWHRAGIPFAVLLDLLVAGVTGRA
jgi:D-alanine-D-alanine ligase